MINFLEERSMNALPALQTVIYDGWILRFANGYTRRANSVNCIYRSALPLDEKIAHCESLYRRRGQSTVFKLTDAAQPADLDARLDARGYRKTESVSLQTYVVGMNDLPPASDEIHFASAVGDAWLADYIYLNDTPAQHGPTLRRMLDMLVPSAAFASITCGGQTVAIGLAVLEMGYLGLFDIVVAKSQRRQGLGRTLVGGLLDWGKCGGATHAYLQVVDDNLPAQAMYAQLGFGERYRYWYRTRPLE